MPTDLLVRPTPSAPDIVDDATRREFLAGAAALLVAAACASEKGTDAAPTRGTAAPASRRVRHGLGETDVPARPERVVCLTGPGLDNCLALGVTPVAAVGFHRTQAVSWAKVPPTVEVVEGEINLERVASFRPDLILGWSNVMEQEYQRYSSIGPSVGVPIVTTPRAGSIGDIREAFAVVADAVNRQEQEKEVLGDLSARIASFGAAAKRKGPLPSVSLLGFYEPAAAQYFEASRPALALLAEAGFTVVSPPERIRSFSVERLPELTADFLLVFGGGGGEAGPKSLADAQATPLWSRVPAVAAGRWAEVSAAVGGGFGILWAFATLDEVSRIFAS
ncbi:MAG: ABC transporter substrate-binding protein [Acidimicrobiales bacterium]